ncbi:heavy-metal-associated domain-containing protein [Gelidibacter salicanalis]|uniref:Heavy-metal-associated domain-containing protein n=1 Tax=Gelidibacter salicanalis TaxID=291193 RepID=A0A5C7AHF3_9FLAO|nr:heavy metal-associated domain-containing protein [Gelidibacter salicanalis]TXE07757.1 heavy-metal-associated domain-containing protein [Gelidibacter salicanalis]
MNHTSIEIQNLKCGGCAHTIKTKLSTLKHITNLEVNVEENKVSFDYLDDADANAVKENLNDLGYPAVADTNSLSTKAKSFVSCAIGKLSQ